MIADLRMLRQSLRSRKRVSFSTSPADMEVSSKACAPPLAPLTEARGAGWVYFALESPSLRLLKHGKTASLNHEKIDNVPNRYL